ncbi:MAG: hypothetical protein WA001_03540 [Patescibacteria group bacterium]
MTRPREALGLRQPLGRRLPQGIVAWNIAVAAATLVFVCAYVVQVNTAAAKGYALRTVQTQVDGLNTDTLTLQDQIASQSSLSALATRATALGFAPVNHLSFVNPIHSSYAMAR